MYIFQNEIKCNVYKAQSLSYSRSSINGRYYYPHFIYIISFNPPENIGKYPLLSPFSQKWKQGKKKLTLSIRSQSEVRFHFSLLILVLVLSPFPCDTVVSQIERSYLLVFLVIIVIISLLTFPYLSISDNVYSFLCYYLVPS